jgi:hypothetical protein
VEYENGRTRVFAFRWLVDIEQQLLAMDLAVGDALGNVEL